MAECQVIAISGAHAQAFKQWDVVSVQDDGFVWGTKDKLPAFYIIKIPGITKAQLLPYIQPEYIMQNPANGMAYKRGWTWADIPQAAKDELAATGEYTLTANPNTWRHYLKNKTTGDSATI
jgi:hypothetical protein